MFGRFFAIPDEKWTKKNYATANFLSWMSWSQIKINEIKHLYTSSENHAWFMASFQNQIFAINFISSIRLVFRPDCLPLISNDFARKFMAPNHGQSTILDYFVRFSTIYHNYSWLTDRLSCILSSIGNIPLLFLKYFKLHLYVTWVTYLLL